MERTRTEQDRNGANEAAVGSTRTKHDTNEANEAIVGSTRTKTRRARLERGSSGFNKGQNGAIKAGTRHSIVGILVLAEIATPSKRHNA